ncbi:MAG: 30S processome protein Utp24 [archaeon]|nr:30S processome protein Utp24 [archaeon]MCP8314297.1 30S processome protein Utp24 [archaeon]MCP8317126.1 30S processome protein Utp24 [archaeon]MCP8322328.1 30S processome protein Utp24 [archaeon]
MRRVLLDASFILTLASKPSNLIEEMEEMLGKVELLVLEDTIKELEAISKRPSIKRSKQAKLALNFVIRLERIAYAYEGSVDDKILRCAMENRLLVATMDKELRKRLRAMGLSVITLRENRLIINGARL